METAEDETTPPSGERLTTRAQMLGTPAEFRRLVSLMVSRVDRLGVGDHVHVMDVVQDAFATAICKINSESLTFENRSKFEAWMGVLVEDAVRTNRKPSRKRVFLALAADAEIDNLTDPINAPGIIDEQPALRLALQKLKPSERWLVEQHVLEEKSFGELAAEHCLKKSTLHARCVGALEVMRSTLEQLEIRPGRRRKAAAVLFPFFLLGLFARDAGAKVGAAIGWLASHLRRSPMRVLAGVGTTAAILAATSHATPQKVLAPQPEPPIVAVSIDSTPPSSEIVLSGRAEHASEPRASRPGNGGRGHAGPLHGPNLHWDKPSPFDWIASTKVFQDDAIAVTAHKK